MTKALLLPVLACLALQGCMAPGGPDDGSAATAAARYLDTIRDDPVALRRFLRPFPKGADLHSHLSGAVYAESYIGMAERSGLCVYVEIHTLSDCQPAAADGDYTRARLADWLEEHPRYRYRLIDAFSMRNFVPEQGGPSGADQFFSSFDRFNAATVGNSPAMIAEVANRAGRQNIAYLELMHTPDAATFLGMGAGLAWSDDVDSMARALDTDRFRSAVAEASRAFTRDLAGARERMGCAGPTPSPGCAVEIRLLAQALRDIDNIGSVFALIMACFELAADNPQVAGVNFVMREDGRYALRDYDRHMRIMRYFTRRHEQVPLSLHAGELTLGLVPPEALQDHIESALDSGARRIGHGIDIAFETRADDTLARMADGDILVEINLSSNDAILNVHGDEHPFMLYRRHGVPVALSTDDEGVLRTDLTQEYVRAVLGYDLDYAALKELARDALRHAFLPAADRERLLGQLEQDFRAFEAAGAWR